MYVCPFLLVFQTLSAADLRDPMVSSLIASKLKEFHDLDMPGEAKVFLWERLRYTLVLIHYCLVHFNMELNIWL